MAPAFRLKNNSREHHWWPVALQSQWATGAGDLSWITPSGQINSKKYYNRKIAKKSHGHTMAKGSVWETNFESEFAEADNSVDELVRYFRQLRHPFSDPAAFLTSVVRIVRKGRGIENSGMFSQIPQDMERKFLNLAASLLARSPANREAWEGYPERYGLPRHTDTAKANIRQEYVLVKERILRGQYSRKAFVALRSIRKEFHCGDGYLGSMVIPVHGKNGTHLCL